MPRPPLLATLAVALIGIALWAVWSPPGANDVVGGDEGYYGTMARNILASPRYLASTSLTPLGPPGDKPPLYPAILALSLRLFGVDPAPLRAPSLVFAAITVLATASLAARAAGPAGAWAGPLGALFLVSLPWFADASRGAGAEIPLTAFAVAAIACVAGGTPSRGRAVAAGALLGAAFLCKLWLVAPVALALVALLAGDAVGRRRLALLVAVAAGVGILQLLAVAIVEPGALSHWLGIYFGRSLAERVSGSGYAPGWNKPFDYYRAMLVRALALLLPLVAAGVEVAWRRRREPLPRALIVWAAGIELVSLFAVKSGAYAYVVVPAWVVLAAIGLHAVALGFRVSWWTVGLGALATAPFATAAETLPLAVWLGSWALFAAVRLVPARAPGWRWGVAALLVPPVVVGLWREAQRLPQAFHAPGYGAVAAVMAPRLADVPPDRIAYVAPEAPAFAFHLFRTGEYWATPATPWSAARRQAVERDTSLRFFVVDPGQQFYGGWPDSSTLAWLERSMPEVTDEVEARLGRPLPLRVFARPDARKP